MVRRLGCEVDISALCSLGTPTMCGYCTGEGAIGATSLDDFVNKLSKPRRHGSCVPGGDPTEQTGIGGGTTAWKQAISSLMGGYPYYKDVVRRAKALKEKGIHYVDVGTSGGVWGLERGYCLMIGGESDVVKHLTPVFRPLRQGLEEYHVPQDVRTRIAPRNMVIFTAVQMALGIS